ncbi:MAG: type II toxin-antitoxin system HicB family antitoxin [Pseudomonadota bacterium]
MIDSLAYRIVLTPNPTDEGGGWVAQMPDLPGCTGDGATESEAIEDVRNAAFEWIETAKRQGWPVPRPSHHVEAAE